MTNLYAERDIIAQGNYYSRHVSAMTGEGLHDKSDIAAELAHRDMRIAELEAENEQLRINFTGCHAANQQLRKDIDELEAESASQKDVIDMLAQPKAEIEIKRLCWVRGLTAVCADVAELDREIVLEIGRLRGNSDANSKV